MPRRYDPLTSPTFNLSSPPPHNMTSQNQSFPSLHSPPLTALPPSSSLVPSSSSSSSSSLPLSLPRINTNSMELSCLSPNQQSLHSLDLNQGCIITQFLPLQQDDGEDQINNNNNNNRLQEIGEEMKSPSEKSSTFYDYKEEEPSLALVTSNNNNNNSNNNNSTSSEYKKPIKITTPLPPYILQSLSIDAPLELICIDNDDPHSSMASPTKSLPLLCLYTAKAAYILDIRYSKSSSSTSSSRYIQGHVHSITEPFESHLSSSSSSNNNNNSSMNIIRIKCAPQSYMYGGDMYDTLCQRGACAMLCSCTEMSQLVLYHGTSSSSSSLNYTNSSNTTTTTSMESNHSTTIATTISPEQMTDMNDTIVDFTFIPSSNNSNNNNFVWNAMGVYLTTQTGLIYGVSPIVFHSCLYPKRHVQSAVRFLQELEVDYNGGGKEDLVCWRRIKTTLQFFKDAFGSSAFDLGQEEPEDVENEENRHGSRRNGNGSGNSTSTSENSGYYLMANILQHFHNSKTATRWPIAIQGPLYSTKRQGGGEVGAEGEVSEEWVPNVVGMEVISPPPPSPSLSSSSSSDHAYNSGSMSGILLAFQSPSLVHYVILPSGDELLPRFAFENEEDAEYLDGLVRDCGLLVDRLQFGNSDDDDGDTYGSENNQAINSIVSGNTRNATLIPDPIIKSMVHYVYRRGVVTITSDSMEVVEKRIRNGVVDVDNPATDTSSSSSTSTSPLTIDTRAWYSVEIPDMGEGSGSQQHPRIRGVVVSGDAQFGHIMILTLSNGETVSINLTATQYLKDSKGHLMQEYGESFPESNDASNSNSNEGKDEEVDEALKALDDIEPLYKLISPLFDDLSKGLSGMGKVVGLATNPRDITPGALATFLSSKQKCEEEIVQPLEKLNLIVSKRRKYNDEMYQHQVEQVKQIKDNIALLKQNMDSTKERISVTKSNYEVISERSACVLAATRSLKPALTNAEKEYFKDLQRYQTNCTKWENVVSHFQNSLNNKKEQPLTCASLTEEQIKICHDLQDGEAKKLKESQDRVARMEESIRKMTSLLGLLDEERSPLADIHNK